MEHPNLQWMRTGGTPIYGNPHMVSPLNPCSFGLASWGHVVFLEASPNGGSFHGIAVSSADFNDFGMVSGEFRSKGIWLVVSNIFHFP